MRERRRAPALGHRRAVSTRCSTGCARRARESRRRVDRHRLLGGRLRPAERRRRCSATRSTTATTAPHAVVDDVHAHRRRRRALRRQRAAVPAVQHAVPAGGRAARPAVGPRRARRAAPRPARLLAHRRAAHRAHERLDHRPARRPHRRLGPTLLDRLGLPPTLLPAARSSPATVRGRCVRTSRADSVCRDRRRDDGRLARHRLGGRRRARDRRRLRLHLLRHLGARRARARRSRCSPRPAARANFTNEGGVDGRIRFLHNVVGSGCSGVDAGVGRDGDRADLADAARRGRGGPDRRTDRRRRRPASSRRATCRPASPTRPTRPLASTPAADCPACIVESLAAGFARTLAPGRRRSRATSGARRPHRRRRVAERAALPAHRRPAGRAGARRTGRGDRARQRLVQARALGAVPARSRPSVPSRHRHPLLTYEPPRSSGDIADAR